MKINFKEERKLFWPLACLSFNITRILTPVFRNKKIWIFGAQNGYKYDDNSMYLFEYVNNNSLAIQPIWLTREHEVVRLVRSYNYKAYHVYSFRGILYALRGKVVFYTAGLTDFGLFPLVGGATVVSLWHGVGFKKIYNETYSGKSLKLKRILDMLFSWTYRNIAIATSEYSKNKTIRQFDMNPSDVYITGQPRNDIFREKIKFNDVFKNASIIENKKILLYMPTYRWSSQGYEIVPQIIDELYNNEQFRKVINDNNLIFIAKLHPRTKIDQVIKDDDFIIIRDQDISSNQKLLTISHLMLTDYSSAFIDFSLLNKPVIFYTPDIDEYINKAGGMDSEFFTLTEMNRVRTIDQLSDLISKWDRKDTLKQTEVTNTWFEDASIRGTNYSENVYKLVCDLINLI